MTAGDYAQVGSPGPEDSIDPPAPALTPAPSIPGRTLGIVGFVFSFVTPFNVAGLVISIVALVKSRRAGHRNGFALAGMIIAIAGLLFTGVALANIVPPLIGAVHTCERLGNGVHVIGKSTYTCTPTSISEYTSN
jgi:NO-binding membrane sensor protein with MHYT domain